MRFQGAEALVQSGSHGRRRLGVKGLEEEEEEIRELREMVNVLGVWTPNDDFAIIFDH